MLQALSRWKTSILVVSAFLAAGLFLSRHLVGPLSGGEPPAEHLPLEPAGQHIGERLKICGDVAEVTYAPKIGGKPTFINLGEKHPNQPLTTLIWGENRARWPQPPEVRYGGETICVTGEADLHEGTPQIVVSSPKQIQVR